MHEETLRQSLRPTMAETGLLWFIRLLAIYSIACGLYYWVRLIGVYPGLLWRFDLMPWQWQTAFVGLAILFPVAATGLWLRAAWGPVIWFFAASIEIGIYSYWARMFEYRPEIVAVNVACILLYIVLRGILFWQRRQQNNFRFTD